MPCLRSLLKTPGFTSVAVLILALGIGANTAVFGVVNVLVLRPLPGDAPGEMVGLFSRDRTQPDRYRGFSYPNYADIRARTDAFASLAAHTFALVGVTEGDTTRRAFAALVSANYFSTIGVRLPLGRAFTPAEEAPGSHERVAIASDEYWRRTGAGPDLLGRSVMINAQPFTIVGVAPAGFGGTMAVISPEFWLPTGVYELVANDFFREGPHATLADRRHHTLVLFGRLQPDLTMESATPRVRTLGRQMEQAFPAENRDQDLSIHPLLRYGVSTSPQSGVEMTVASAMLVAVAAIVLLVACLNLANMMLARGAARRKEIAVRLALGASRARIVRQLLAEGLALSIAGGAAGLVLAYWANRLLVATLAPLFPVIITYRAEPDVRVLAATLGFALLSTLAFALGPAWTLAGADALPGLKEQADEYAARPGRRVSTRNLLVAGQLALSLVLLTAGGLFVRGALRAADADPGFGLAGGLVAGLDPSLAGYDAARGQATYRILLAKLRNLPGVASASLASVVPFGEFTETNRVRRAGAPAGERAESGVAAANYTIVGRDYFRTLGLPVLRGRGFTAAEEEAPGAPVVILDEPLARRLFGDGDPIGQRVEILPRDGDRAAEAHEVVGLVPGVRHSLFDTGPAPHVYVPFGRQYRASMIFHVRAASAAGEGALLQAVRREMRALDPRLPVVTLQTLEAHRDRSIVLWAIRTGARILTTFGAVALLLAVVGVYGVKAYVVSRRTREIGIRMALGASARDVVWLVVRESLAVTAAGVGVGLALAVVAGRLLSTMLYEVSALDPVVFVVAPVVLAGSALAAACAPVRRATRVDPVTALRAP